LRLLRPRFIPPPWQRDVREQVNRVQKVLESANIKLTSVAMDM
jgi:hypothetical protein